MTEPTLEGRLAARQYPDQRSPMMEQTWRHLLFLHWEYDPAEIQKTLPPGLSVDLFEGKAYVGITPLWISEVKVKFLPMIPGFSNLFELSLRTYVYDEKGRPGVWFYSLEANHFLAVQAAKNFFSLPYRYSSIQSLMNEQGEIEFSCRPEKSDLILNYRYKGEAPFEEAKIGSLEFFLVERYFLFTSRSNELAVGQIHHAPSAVCRPQLLQWDDRLFMTTHLSHPMRNPDHVLYSPFVKMEVFPFE